MTKVAIMQPTYLPWAGYFGLLNLVDLFIILDDVQFDKRSWQQRNRIKSSSGELFLTVPVKSKGKFYQKINEVKIDTEREFEKAHLKSILLSYNKSKYSSLFNPVVEEIFGKKHKSLLNLNLALIKTIKKLLNIKTDLIFSSDLKQVGSKADLLCNLCEQVEAKNYIAPPGSKMYITETDIFERKNIKINYFDFKHPIYNQLYGDFIPYLSCIDLIYNCGEKSKQIIQKSSSIED